MQDNQRGLIFAMLVAVLALTALCYWPSLSGPFIFDDRPNLSPLGADGGIDNWKDLLQFVTSGNAGPLGRPVSLASFAINAQDWPADPFSFRVTNLIIHLINGLLVFVLARMLLVTQHKPERAAQMALLAAAFWLLHPLLVSTTAFIVQRMTQLSCLFVLLSLVGYLHGRKSLTSAPWRGWAWILGSMLFGGLLALYSKESGVLLPVFALCIEATVFAREPGKHHKLLLCLFALPSLIIAGYLLARIPGASAAFAFRDFTLAERLMTEARVLADYLSRIFALRMAGAGLYHDDFTISKGLLNPPSTLACIGLLLGMLVTALTLRSRYPFIALAALWFLAGHSLESTVIPLELYYEHRNYLPLVGIAIAAGSLAVPTWASLRRIILMIALLFITLESFITWQNAEMWSSQDLIVHYSIQEHPTSLRALERGALWHAHKKEHEKTLEYLQRIVDLHPERNAIRLSIVQTRCLLNRLKPEHFADVMKQLARGKHEKESILYLPEFMRLADKKVCNAMNYDALHELLDALATQSRKPGPGAPIHLIHFHHGMLYLKQGRLNQALQHMDQSNQLQPTIDKSLLLTVWMISVNNYERAQRYLDIAARLNANIPFWQENRDNDIQGYQAMINKGPENPDFVPFTYPLTPDNQ